MKKNETFRKKLPNHGMNNKRTQTVLIIAFSSLIICGCVFVYIFLQQNHARSRQAESINASATTLHSVYSYITRGSDATTIRHSSFSNDCQVLNGAFSNIYRCGPSFSVVFMQKTYLQAEDVLHQAFVSSGASQFKEGAVSEPEVIPDSDEKYKYGTTEAYLNGVKCNASLTEYDSTNAVKTLRNIFVSDNDLPVVFASVDCRISLQYPATNLSNNWD